MPRGAPNWQKGSYEVQGSFNFSIFLILKISQIYTRGKKFQKLPISFVEKKSIPKETLVSTHAKQTQNLPAVFF
jgi:hypothetical protein